MLIECRQRRSANHRNPRGGTQVTLFGRRYHFRPQPELLKGRNADADPDMHICEVTDEKAIARFMAIPEAYNKVGAPPQIPQLPKVEAVGQPAITTELIDDDDVLGPPDVNPLDPLAIAKAAQAQWIEEMLAMPVKNIKAINFADLDDAALEKMLEQEKAAGNRATVIGFIETAQASRAAAPASDAPSEADES